ncbi:CatB-related O-acetyltransferase [Staphylococcus sp. GDH8C109P]|uniref:CatB-related O-acetyltransferase n=1 Tax=Staphylococcus sp. GDH8C109P TaxID=2804088 RepID=UPI001AEBBDBC|nr:CatB-related O-acetyltransferase [Staphylococcus sp. GDH8C109P]
MLKKLLFKIIKGKNNVKGKNVIINPLAYVVNSNFSGNNFVDRLCRIRNTSFGNYSYIGFNSDLNNVQIGSYCSISSDVKIGLGKHPINFFSTSPIFYSSKNPFNLNINKVKYDDRPDLTIIENDVWIGTNVIIIDGVTIGNGAIIAAGSIVTENVGEYEIVGGVPAKVIKRRFDESTIQKLLESKWWERDAKELIDSQFNL